MRTTASWTIRPGCRVPQSSGRAKELQGACKRLSGIPSFGILDHEAFTLLRTPFPSVRIAEERYRWYAHGDRHVHGPRVRHNGDLAALQDGCHLAQTPALDVPGLAEAALDGALAPLLFRPEHDDRSVR